MQRLKASCVLAAAVAAFSTAGLGIGTASAQQTQPLTCPEGQMQVIIYSCNPTTRQCFVLDTRCE